MPLLTARPTIYLGTWNVRTMWETGRVFRIAAEMRRYNLEVLVISKTHWTQVGQQRLASGEMLLYSGHDEENAPHTQGVGLMLSKQVQNALIGWECHGPRIVKASFKTKKESISMNVIQCYAPTNDHNEDAKDQFYNRLQSIVEKCPTKDLTILMGDLNTKVGMDNTGYEDIMGRHELGERNENGERFSNLCAFNKLVIGGTIFTHKRIHKITWTSPDNTTQNQIDYICINEKFRRTMEDVRTQRGGDKAFHDLLNGEGTTMESNWKGIKGAITSTYHEVLGHKKHHHKGWITVDNLDKIQERRKKKAAINTKRTRAEKAKVQTEYTEVNKQVMRSIRTDKRKYVEDLAMTAEKSAREGNIRELYDIRQAPLNPPNIEAAPTDLQIDVGSPTIKEISMAIRQIKSGKAAGPDNIPVEALKADVAVTEQVPKYWKEGLLVKIPKKGVLSNCDNYSDITLRLIPGKVFNRVLLNRMKDCVDAQLHQIATLRIIVEQSLEWDSPLYINFIDYEKAFDSVDRTPLWKLLRHYGVPQKIVNIIRNSYDELNCKILHGGQLTKSFKVKTGVRQGCLLSPFLFLLVIDWVMKTSSSEGKYGMQWTARMQLNDLDFEDDLALLSHTQQQMQEKTISVTAASAAVGLNIHKGKSKILRYNTECTNQITLDEADLEDGKTFTYLGSIIDEQGGSDAYVKVRIGKARTA
ncbi:unnamed protein product [Schistosoma curassoni]|uniref:Reverse transcriptase domain-containing protein n=1 Tax=Schistosoma curassoni TaxID=6186 RepID=A0A183K1D8_9TREM|nr:unnamed protein product [Schistosoma curassoni]